MPGLILEGGTFRPLFSCGVLDALLEEGIHFPYCIGVSAGISDAMSYIAGQKGRELEIVKKYRNDRRYLGVSNYRKNGSLFGTEFIFGEIPDRLVPLDRRAFMAYRGKVLVGVTNAATGRAEYMDAMEMDEKYTMLRATCALPMFFPAVELYGKKYYDGGISDPIPIRKAIEDGNEKNLIILTRPKGYEKKLRKADIVAARRLEKRYPRLARVLVHRPRYYNETVRFCEQLENEGKVLIIRPESPLESFQKDVEKLVSAHGEGYALAKKQMVNIRSLFEI